MSKIKLKKKTEKLFLNKIAHFPMCNQKIDVRRRFRVTLSVRMEWFKYFRKSPLLIHNVFLLNQITNSYTLIGENCGNNVRQLAFFHEYLEICVFLIW